MSPLVPRRPGSARVRGRREGEREDVEWQHARCEQAHRDPHALSSSTLPHSCTGYVAAVAPVEHRAGGAELASAASACDHLQTWRTAVEHDRAQRQHAGAAREHAHGSLHKQPAMRAGAGAGAQHTSGGDVQACTPREAEAAAGDPGTPCEAHEQAHEDKGLGSKRVIAGGVVTAVRRQRERWGMFGKGKLGARSLRGGAGAEAEVDPYDGTRRRNRLLALFK